MMILHRVTRLGPGRTWLFALWLTMVALGIAAVVVGIGIVAQARMRPSPLPVAPFGIPILLGGAAAVCLGANALLLGIGTTGRPLSPGSHRAVVLTTVLALGGALLVLGLYLLLDPGGLGDAPRTFLVGALGLYGSFGLMLYLHGVRSGALTRSALGLSWSKTAVGIPEGAMAALAVLIVAAANGLVLRSLGLVNPQADSFRWLAGRQLGEYLLAGVAVVVLAPIVEELFFRGYVFNAYLAEKGPRTAYVGSALVFGAVHGLPTLFFGIFGMGLVLAFFYRRTGTIVTPMVAHVANNAISFTALLMATRA